MLQKCELNSLKILRNREKTVVAIKNSNNIEETGKADVEIYYQTP